MKNETLIDLLWALSHEGNDRPRLRESVRQSLELAGVSPRHSLGASATEAQIIEAARPAFEELWSYAEFMGEKLNES
jgi:hypothetical protein